ncbi:MAG: hypothetical protein J1F05_07005 [Muribaculaceae bacterium]|nr:hypothetical protein [Muribaculaceae bacterium]
MDIELFKIIGVIVLALLIGWAERSSSQKKNKTAAKKAPIRQKMETPRVVKQETPKRKKKEAIEPKPLLDSEYEGMRITEDLPEPTVADTDVNNGVEPLDHNGLRQAVIWGEILQRKF